MRSFVALYRGFGGGWQLPETVDFVDEATREEMKQRTNWGDLLDDPPQRQ